VQDEPLEPPVQEETPDGVDVFFWRKEGSNYSPEDIEAELPDGTRLKAVEQLGGRRLGFERPVPRGTWILLRGKRTWGPVGDRK
jgi:hypothetical protein